MKRWKITTKQFGASIYNYITESPDGDLIRYEDYEAEKSAINWIRIREKKPPEGVPVLFYSLYSKTYHVGYWNEYEDGMSQYDPKSGMDGWKWDVSKWALIE
jgi:hypothetical protein